METRGWTFERASTNEEAFFFAIAECDLHSVNGTVTRCRDKLSFWVNGGDAIIQYRNARNTASVDESAAQVWHQSTDVSDNLLGTWTGWVSDQDDHSVLVLAGEDESNPRVVTFFPPKGSWYVLHETATETFPSVSYMPHPWQDSATLFSYIGNSGEYSGTAYDTLRTNGQYAGQANSIPYIVKNYHEWRAMGVNQYSFDLACIRQNDVHTYFVPDGGHMYWGSPKLLKYNDIYYIVNGSGGRTMLLEVGTQRPW